MIISNLDYSFIFCVWPAPLLEANIRVTDIWWSICVSDKRRPSLVRGYEINVVLPDEYVVLRANTRFTSYPIAYPTYHTGGYQSIHHLICAARFNVG
jgi:hypothetical protein